MRTMKMPKGVSRRWTGEIAKVVPAKTKVRVDQHWDFTEVCCVAPDDLVAAFRAKKHAVEFCRMNRLEITCRIAGA